MILIKNGHVKTMSGPDIIGGDVLIENGKIKAVGKNLSAEGATVIDAAGRLVTPGFVEAHCHIGLDNEAMGWEGHDYNEIVEPCTPQLRAIDSINPIDEAFMNAVKGGVTTAVTGPGSANVIGGTFVAIKLYGKRVDNMIVKNPVAMKVAFGENPKRCYSNMKKSPSTRMATAALLREMLFKTKRYMEDKEEAEKLIKIGDVAVFNSPTVELAGNNVMTPYADDLISCVVLLLAMEHLKDKTVKNDLYFVFSVQEEVGLRGAMTAAYHIDPYMGIAVDVCGTGDTPTSTIKMAVKVGEGPTIKIKDGSLICNPQAVAHMRKAADEIGVKYQDEILLSGGTDSGAMQRTRGGVYSGCISIPTRHIHSPSEIFNKKDVEDAGRLLAQCALNEL